MNEKTQIAPSEQKKEQENEGISLLLFWNVLRDRLIWLLLAVVIGAGAMFGYTKLFIKPTYSCSAKFWVQITATGSASLSSSYLQGTSKLSDNYVEAINGNVFLNEYIVPAYNTKNGTNYTAAAVSGRVKVSAASDTNTIIVRVTDRDPDSAYALLKCFEEVIPQVFNDETNDKGFYNPNLRVTIINEGTKPSSPSSPNVRRNVLLGAAGAFVLVYLIFFLIAVFDRTVNSDENLKDQFTLPVMGQIPQWLKPGETPSSALKEEKRMAREAVKTGKRPTRDYTDKLISKKTPFSITEAFKTLRTNMLYGDTKGAAVPVWGVTSDYAGAGKSFAIANVAVSFAMLDKKVLLIDGDMRCPVQHRIFGVSRHRSGLSEALVGIAADPLTECVIKTSQEGLDLMVCGHIPPNPGELLASERMEQLFAAAKEKYDYIFVDLPPINETADAGVIASMVDAYLLIVRAGFSTIDATRDALELLGGAHANVVGFVLNDVNGRGDGKYGKYGKYSKYSKYGYRRYGRYRAYDITVIPPEEASPTDAANGAAQDAKQA